MSQPPTLLRTSDMASLLRMRVPVFLAWAHRHGLRPVTRQRIGRSTVAWWDADAVWDLEREHPRFDAPE